MWCWRRLLRVLWTVGKSNQSVLKEISPGCSLEGLMLKLKLQYFGHLMRRVDSLEKTLMLGGIGDRRRRGWQRMRWHHRLDGREFGWTPGVGDGQGGLVCRNSWGRKESDMTERLNWTELKMAVLPKFTYRLLSKSKWPFLQKLKSWFQNSHRNEMVPSSQNNLERKDEDGGLILHDFKT